MVFSVPVCWTTFLLHLSGNYLSRSLPYRIWHSSSAQTIHSVIVLSSCFPSLPFLGIFAVFFLCLLSSQLCILVCVNQCIKMIIPHLKNSDMLYLHGAQAHWSMFFDWDHILALSFEYLFSDWWSTCCLGNGLDVSLSFVCQIFLFNTYFIPSGGMASFLGESSSQILSHFNS